ncbi:amidohydrolase [Bosea sp. (in: a-proteobacteria)]|uniref:amidohydrolase family protein n=1 Tax=Bosea sp. (in: a-proteobacteria) TaxID=1871050 RepID=UPI0026111704|nr:amidohydrolase family protein [Bosea sp. (in: a-proteobacteria)]MCO5092926.1 amidohydrolase family protein [Bosea sp. (in: a-proteobacteria)]
MIDAHQHFWATARGDYGWLTPEAGVLYRDFGAEDLSPLLARHGITGTILVQAAQTVAETRYLLDIAERAPFVLGVVGWVDFTAPDAARQIAELAGERLLVGLRPMVQDLDDDDWLLRRDIAPAIAAMQEHGLVFDALVYPRHLPRLCAFLDRYPGLPVVLDHGGKPEIRNAALDPWRADIAAIAARPRTLCKVSGLATEARGDWSAKTLRPYVDHLLAVFGPARLMWGSDWPVLTKAGSYDSWREAAQNLLGGLKPAEKAAVFGGNAARFYLGPRGRRPG